MLCYENIYTVTASSAQPSKGGGLLEHSSCLVSRKEQNRRYEAKAGEAFSGESESAMKPSFRVLLPLLPLLTPPAEVQAQFNYTTNDGAITITQYTGSDSDVTIPSTINGLPVTSLGGFSF